MIYAPSSGGPRHCVDPQEAPHQPLFAAVARGAAPMANDGYQFRPMTAADLPLVRYWLSLPHVTQWWGEPGAQFTLVSGDLDEPAMDQFVVHVDARPFAYLQCYDPSVWPEGGLGTHPSGTRGIDQFIGEADMLDCGHGSAFIRSFTDRLLAAGAPRVVTDPDPTNLRAIRAYEKAGFRKDREVDTPDGRSFLMVRDPVPAQRM